MLRSLLPLVALLVLPLAAAAQIKPAPASPPAAAASALTPAQAQAALEVLGNDAERARLMATLQTIARAQALASAPTAAPAGAPPPVAPAGGAAAPASASAPGTAPGVAQGKLPIPLAPDSLGAEVLAGASDRISALSSDLVETARAATDFPLLSRWVRNVLSDPNSRASLIDAAWKLAIVLAAAVAVERILVHVLRRPLRSLAARAPTGLADTLEESDDEPPSPTDPPVEAGQAEAPRKRHRPSPLTLLRRLPFILGRFGLDMLPVLCAVALGYGLLGTSLGEPRTTRLVILAVLNAYALSRTIVCCTRLLVSPSLPRLRLFAMHDDTAAFILIWTRRITNVAVFGYALTEVGLLFGLYLIAHDALIKLVALIVHAMLVIVVLRSRAKVARKLRARSNARGMFSAALNRFAAVWHWVAIFYIVALWLVWAFEVPNGFARLVRFFLATVIVLTVGRLLAVAAMGAIDRALRVSEETSARYPGLEARLHNYHPIARFAVSFVLTVGSMIVLLEAWGVDSLAWFTGDALGTRLLSSGAVMGLTVLVALAVWELTNAAIQRHLDRLTREAQIARSARLRTLLPMFRTALFVAIGLFTVLTVLSEIGLNIAPLLAGAGVVGVAIGFGSQKLVQDVITGLFLLLENAMQVGDVVTLGGMSGTVENLSIRTIRLRALDGAVHIVPFSAVTTVTNMTRDFGFALLDVSVGLDEEPDHIADLLRDVVAAMREEPRWTGSLRDELEVMGVEKFIDMAWVLRVRVKTLPSQRWAVSRELNKRIKSKFDELAIESPFTSHRVLSTPLPPPAPAPPPEEAAA